MKKDRILEAREQADRFIARCDAVLDEFNGGAGGGPASGYHYGSPASGALRRQSMELTRALALMRRST